MDDDDTRLGRDAFDRRAWREAFGLLSRAAHATPLGGADLERLANAAYLLGDHIAFRDALERAHRLYLRHGERCRAARCAFWLGLTLLFRGDAGQAGGWLARARRHVDGVDCVEHGYLLLPLAEQRLRAGDGAAAESVAADAVAIAERFGDTDLGACAWHVQGRALIAQRRSRAGLALLDEAMLPVITGELSPIVTGLIYCSVIAACQQVFELRRAREWTSALARWCEAQPDMVAFTDTCLVHRAEILQRNGAWPEAMAEVCRASDGADVHAAAAARYVQGDIHRLRGELVAADRCYRDAAALGGEPQPGRALLRLAQRRPDAARAAIEPLLAAASDPLQRATLLPAHIEISLALDAPDNACDGCAELERIAADFDTDVLRAMAAQARGSVELARGDARASLNPLRRAFAIWQQLEAPHEAARTRVLLGLACRSLGDEEAATLEFDAAGAAFARLGAAPDLARVDALRRRAGGSPHALTVRELEVLRLVAAGDTNKAIAARLRLSERTVDRHVSNILTKLAVPSRAAATAWAYERRLL
jgi:DNA-binding CsgD family transcriptional regulator